jgi:hypothetical protein
MVLVLNPILKFSYQPGAGGVSFKNWLPMLARLYLSICLFVRPNQELIPTPHV